MRTTINEYGEQVVTMTLEERGPLTQAEKDMIRSAQLRPSVYDEDCPPMTTEQLLDMKPGYFSKRKVHDNKVMV